MYKYTLVYCTTLLVFYTVALSIPGCQDEGFISIWVAVVIREHIAAFFYLENLDLVFQFVIIIAYYRCVLTYQFLGAH